MVNKPETNIINYYIDVDEMLVFLCCVKMISLYTIFWPSKNEITSLPDNLFLSYSLSKELPESQVGSVKTHAQKLRFWLSQKTLTKRTRFVLNISISVTLWSPYNSLIVNQVYTCKSWGYMPYLLPFVHFNNICQGFRLVNIAWNRSEKSWVI